MADKKYTLELTAEELGVLIANRAEKPCAPMDVRMHKLFDQAKADRERDDLRLPWRAIIPVGAPDCVWHCVDGNDMRRPKSARAAKLMSAAPELLEAVKAWNGWDSGGMPFSQEKLEAAREATKRALRKVETGEVEP